VNIHNYSESLAVFNKDIAEIKKEITSLPITSNKDLIKKITELRISISNWQKSEYTNLKECDIVSIQEINTQVISVVADIIGRDKRKHLLAMSDKLSQHIQSFIEQIQQAEKTYKRTPLSKEEKSFLKKFNYCQEKLDSTIYVKIADLGNNNNHAPVELQANPDQELSPNSQSLEETHQGSSLDKPPEYTRTPHLSLNGQSLEGIHQESSLDKPPEYTRTPHLSLNGQSLEGIHQESSSEYNRSPQGIGGEPQSEYAPSGFGTLSVDEEIKFSTAAPWAQNLTRNVTDQPIDWPPIHIDQKGSLKRHSLKTSIDLSEETFNLLSNQNTSNIVGDGKDKQAFQLPHFSQQFSKHEVEKMRDGFKEQSPESKGLVIQDNLEQVLRAYLPFSKVIAKKVYKAFQDGAQDKAGIKKVSSVLKKYGFDPIINPKIFDPAKQKIKDKEANNRNRESLRQALVQLYSSEENNKDRKIVCDYISWYIGTHLIEKPPIVLVFDKAVQALGVLKEDVIKQESQMVDALTSRIQEAQMYQKNWKSIKKMVKLPKSEQKRIEKVVNEIIKWQTCIVRNKMVIDNKAKPTGAMSPLYALGSLDHLDRKLLNGKELRDGFKGVAEAMWVAHQLGVLHNDISTRNIFVTLILKKNNNSKEKKEGEVAYKFGLGDWGLAQLADKSKKGSVGQEALRPLKWIAPESFILQPSGSFELSDKTDVWAFGITLVEQVSGDLSAFLGSPTNFEFMQQLTQDIAPNGNNHASGPNTFMMKCLERFQMDKNQKVKFTPEAIEMLKKIFENNPQKRLNAHEIVRFLEEMKKNDIPLCI
jgi:hypothetical protein